MFFRRAPEQAQGTHRHQLARDVPETQEILDLLRKSFSSPDYNPPLLPAVAMEVHQLSRKPDVAVRDMVQLIERDVTLAADALRLAQSPIYATRVPPKTLDEGAVRLGVEGLRNLVFEVALRSKVFRAKPPLSEVMAALRTHSLIVAHLSKAIAAHTALYEESAYLVGLLHDIGLACSLLVLGDQRDRTIDLELTGWALVEVHAEAGDTVAKLWELPSELRIAVAAHHRGTWDGHPHPLGCTTILAEHITDMLGYGIQFGEDVFESPGPAARELASKTLGVNQTTLERIAKANEAKVSALADS